jgi:hypothetical protein
MATVGWLGTELGVGDVAKGHLRFILFCVRARTTERQFPVSIFYILGQCQRTASSILY